MPPKKRWLQADDLLQLGDDGQLLECGAFVGAGAGWWGMLCADRCWTSVAVMAACGMPAAVGPGAATHPVPRSKRSLICTVPRAAACEKAGELLRCCSCPHAFHPECAGYGEQNVSMASDACAAAHLLCHYALPVCSGLTSARSLHVIAAGFEDVPVARNHFALLRCSPSSLHSWPLASSSTAVAAGFEDVPVARGRWHCWYCAGAKAFKHPTSKVGFGYACYGTPALPCLHAQLPQHVHISIIATCCIYLPYLQLAVKAGGKLLVAYTDECQVRKKNVLW